MWQLGVNRSRQNGDELPATEITWPWISLDGCLKVDSVIKDLSHSHCLDSRMWVGFKTEMCTSTSVSIRHRVKEIRTVIRNLGRCEPHARDKI